MNINLIDNNDDEEEKKDKNLLSSNDAIKKSTELDDNLLSDSNKLLSKTPPIELDTTDKIDKDLEDLEDEDPEEEFSEGLNTVFNTTFKNALKDIEQHNELQDFGYSEDQIAEIKLTQDDEKLITDMTEQELYDLGFEEKQIQDILHSNDITEYRNNAFDNIHSINMSNHWATIMEDVSEWAVGDDADWEEYFDRGWGKGNINLALKYHFGTGIDVEEAFSAEPGDTGNLERLLESTMALIGDSPTFIVGGLTGGYLTRNPYGAAFGAGFVNDAVKEMYMQSLLSDNPPENFKEFSKVFIEHAVVEGIKGGLFMTAFPIGSNIAAKTIGQNPHVNKFMSDYIGRFFGVIAASKIIHNEAPTKESLTNTALLLLMFGGIEKGTSAKYTKKVYDIVNEKVLLEGKTGKQIKNNVTEIMKNTPLLRDIVSLNLKRSKTNKKEREIKAEYLKEEVKRTEIAKEIRDQQAEKPNFKVSSNPLYKKAVEFVQKNQTGKWTDIKKHFKITTKEAKSLVKDLEANEILSSGGTFLKIPQKWFGGKRVRQLQIEDTQLLTNQTRLSETNRAIINLKKEKNKRPDNLEIDKQIKSLEKEKKILNETVKRGKLVVSADLKINSLTKQIKKLTGEDFKIDKTTLNIPKSAIQKSKVIKSGRQPARTVIEQAVDFSKGITPRMIDKLNPIRSIYERMTGKKVYNFNDANNIYETFRIQPGLVGRAFEFINTGTFGFGKIPKTISRTGKSLAEIYNKIKTPERQKELERYMLSETLVERYNKKTGTVKEKTAEIEAEFGGMTLAEAKSAIFHGKRKWEKIYNELKVYNATLLKYLKDSGYLTPKQYKHIKEAMKNYTPAHRIDIDFGAGISAKSAKISSLQRFKGSEKDIKSPLESILLNTYHFITIAERNFALQKLFKQIKDYKKENPKELSEIIETKVKTGEESLSIWKMDGHLKPEGKPIVEGTGWKSGKTMVHKKGGSVQYMENGKLKNWEIKNPYFFEAFRDLNMNNMEMIWLPQALSATKIPAKMLRAGVVLNPKFMIFNFIRDTFTASGFSKNFWFLPYISTGRGANIFVAAKYGESTPLKYIYTKKYVKKSKDLMFRFNTSGGTQATLISYDRNYFADLEVAKYLDSRKSTMHNVIDFAKKPNLNILRDMGDVAEMGSRVENFRLTENRLNKLNKTLPENKRLTQQEILEKAGFEARDITVDFRKMGTIGQFINQQSAFYNANIQGLSKLYEAFSDRAPGTINRKTAPYFVQKSIMYLTLPSMALWWQNKDSEIYKALPQWQKDVFWIIILNEGDKATESVWRIPKPFQQGIIFATIPERMLDWMYHGDDKELKKAVINMFKDTAESVLSPNIQMISPLNDLLNNKNSHTDQAIVARRWEGLINSEKYDQSTSEFSKIVAKYAYDFPVVNNLDWFTSPKKLDYWIKGWTGDVGKTMISIVSELFVIAGIQEEPFPKAIPEKGTINWWQQNVPVVKGFSVRFSSSGNSKYIQDFYEEYKEWSKIEETLKMYENFTPINTPAKIIKLKTVEHETKKAYLEFFYASFQNLNQDLHNIERLPTPESVERYNKKYAKEILAGKKDEQMSVITASDKYNIQDAYYEAMLVYGKEYDDLVKSLANKDNSETQQKLIKETINKLKDLKWSKTYIETDADIDTDIDTDDADDIDDNDYLDSYWNEDDRGGY